MKIVALRSVGLFGETPKGGWSNEIKPDDAVHALVAVHAEDGDDRPRQRLHRCAARAGGARSPGAARPRRERAGADARLAKSCTRTPSGWGSGGTLTHAISGIDIALWDILGKVTGQPVGRLLGGRYRDRVRPYASILMEMPDLMRERAADSARAASAAFKIGWGPFGRREDSKLDEAIVRAAREALATTAS